MRNPAPRASPGFFYFKTTKTRTIYLCNRNERTTQDSSYSFLPAPRCRAELVEDVKRKVTVSERRGDEGSKGYAGPYSPANFAARKRGILRIAMSRRGHVSKRKRCLEKPSDVSKRHWACPFSEPNTPQKDTEKKYARKSQAKEAGRGGGATWIC